MKRLGIALLAGLMLISCTAETMPEEVETVGQAATDVQNVQTAPTEEPEWLTPPEEPVTALVTREEDIPEGETWVPVYYVQRKYVNYYILSLDELVIEEGERYDVYCYYPCNTINPELVDDHEDTLLIEDGGLRLFDLKTGEISELPFSADDFSILWIASDAYTSEITGIVCKTENNQCQFYNTQTQSITLSEENERDYISIFTYNGRCIEQRDTDEGYFNLVYDIHTGELIHTFERHLEVAGTANLPLYLNSRGVNGTNFKVYTSDFTLLTDPDIDYDYAEVTSENTIVLVESITSAGDGVFVPPTSFTVIREDGSSVCTSKEFTEILFASGDHIFVNEDGKLNVYDYKGNYIRTLSDWTDNAYSHSMISGRFGEKTFHLNDYYLAWYKNVGTPEEPVYEKAESSVFPARICYITENLNESLGMDGTGLEFYFDPVTGESGALAVAYIGGYAKPVLYLCPEEETDVTVTFAHPERLTVVYPDYPETGWTVTASPDGTLYDTDGRSYYALYWEESGTISVDWERGFCVAREELTEFLENTLAEIGLTEREANEFIIYWLPVLQKNEYNLIWFELTESRQAMNGLCITPAPDSLLRIAMHVKASDEFVGTSGQTFAGFSRTGFTAVEWGGVVHEG
ncbi:MAG: hypothetical protein IJW81_05730 [Clostridia bacterium]|nr:hypothetical protein [Clostridia bacterium]